MKKLITYSRYLFLAFVILFANNLTAQKTYQKQPLNKNRTITTLAFGSCSNQEKEDQMWKYVVENKPNLWLWLGDIIYADTEDMSVMKKKYDKQKNHPDYQMLLSRCPAIGIWDDHDYGTNDGDAKYSKKQESKEHLLNFLDVSQTRPVRMREGAYDSYTFGPLGNRVKIILLDCRYFREALQDAPQESGNRYWPNESANLLGEAQWQWLEAQLTNSDAQVHLIASGIQVIPFQHGFEKWANFPNARKRLFNLLSKTQPANPIILSGDRHVAEVSKIEIENLNCPLYEITSSGLTHSWRVTREEANKYREGEMVIDKNFAILKIDWDAVPINMNIEVRGIDNELFLSQTIEGQ